MSIYQQISRTDLKVGDILVKNHKGHPGALPPGTKVKVTKIDKYMVNCKILDGDKKFAIGDPSKFYELVID